MTSSATDGRSPGTARAWRRCSTPFRSFRTSARECPHSCNTTRSTHRAARCTADIECRRMFLRRLRRAPRRSSGFPRDRFSRTDAGPQPVPWRQSISRRRGVRVESASCDCRRAGTHTARLQLTRDNRRFAWLRPRCRREATAGCPTPATERSELHARRGRDRERPPGGTSRPADRNRETGSANRPRGRMTGPRTEAQEATHRHNVLRLFLVRSRRETHPSPTSAPRPALRWM